MASPVLLLQATYIGPYYTTAYLSDFNRSSVYQTLKYRPDLFPRSRAQGGMSSNGKATIHLCKDIGTQAPQVVCCSVSIDQTSAYSFIKKDKAEATQEHIEEVPASSPDRPKGSTRRIHLRWRHEGSAASHKSHFYLVDDLPQGHELVLGKNCHPQSSEKPERKPHPVQLGEPKDKKQKDAQRLRNQQADQRHSADRRKADDDRERDYRDRSSQNRGSN